MADRWPAAAHGSSPDRSLRVSLPPFRFYTHLLRSGAVADAARMPLACRVRPLVAELGPGNGPKRDTEVGPNTWQTSGQLWSLPATSGRNWAKRGWSGVKFGVFNSGERGPTSEELRCAAQVPLVCRSRAPSVPLLICRNGPDRKDDDLGACGARGGLFRGSSKGGGAQRGSRGARTSAGFGLSELGFGGASVLPAAFDATEPDLLAGSGPSSMRPHGGRRASGGTSPHWTSDLSGPTSLDLMRMSCMGSGGKRRTPCNALCVCVCVAPREDVLPEAMAAAAVEGSPGEPRFPDPATPPYGAGAAPGREAGAGDRGNRCGAPGAERSAIAMSWSDRVAALSGRKIIDALGGQPPLPQTNGRQRATMTTRLFRIPPPHILGMPCPLSTSLPPTSADERHGNAAHHSRYSKKARGAVADLPHAILVLLPGMSAH